MTDYHYSTEAKVTVAQEKVIGKFCTRCRRHRDPAGGATLKAGSNRTRWVCAPCLTIIQRHKEAMAGVSHAD
jgi:hypothetical protein